MFQGQKEKPLWLKEENDEMRLERWHQGLEQVNKGLNEDPVIEIKWVAKYGLEKNCDAG